MLRLTWVPVVAILCAVVCAEERPQQATAGNASFQPQVCGPHGNSNAVDSNAVVRRMDDYFTEAWKLAGAKVAPTANDAMFMRRVYLDLIGRIPTVAEARVFLADPNPHKRAAIVDKLLNSAEHARSLAVYWRRAWVPQTETPAFRKLTSEIETWLSRSLAENQPYNQIAYDLLTASISGKDELRKASDSLVPPASFLVASGFEPPNLAANSMRSFLGLNLDCAQCHDHPFSRWSREEFWQIAAFFSKANADKRLQIQIPDTDETVGAILLNGNAPEFPKRMEASTGRLVLAKWITARDNKYFAKNAVNLVWAKHFGTGLVMPLDDLSASSPRGHPKLLAELADAFVAHDYDLKWLTRQIVLCKAYQRSSVITDPSKFQAKRVLFARMSVRPLTGEQIYDSLRIAAGWSLERNDLTAVSRSSIRRDFIATFPPMKLAHAQRSIPQSLLLMNGPLMTEITSEDSSHVLQAVGNASFLSKQDKVDILFLSSLSRYPREDESKAISELFIAPPDGERGPLGYADLLWSLLNSTEFTTNH